ncbi:MAG: glycosyltransferase family 2 protein [Ruminococcus sp.]|nr:glycosyltransferase family 2 protein [Ruminococcus sp.]
MKNTVSVIMPVYNRADVVGESIESLIAQSYQHWELIITDSDSQDDTLAICQSFAERDSRIRVYSSKYSGVSDSRNAGLDKVRGEYIFFLDSDDVIHPQLLETLVNAMSSTGAKLGGSGVRYVRHSNWQKVYEDIEKSSEGETEFLTFEKSLDAVFTYTSPINLIGGVMLSREFVGDTRFNTDLHIGEDFYFMYQNLVKGTDVIFLKPRWYYGRLHKSNISNDYSFGGFWSRFHRRELVWQSEESFGRKKYADLQKRDALNVYKAYLIRNNPGTPDGKKICKTVKSYRKIVLPVLNFKDKLHFYLATGFPKVYHKLMGKNRK